MNESIKTFLQTGGDDLADLDSPGWLPYTEICGNLRLGQRSRTRCQSCTMEGADSWCYAPLWCMLLMMSRWNRMIQITIIIAAMH